MSELVSLRKGASALGIALSTLQHHVKRGNVRLIDGKVDIDVARIQLARNADPEQSLRGRMNGGSDVPGSAVGSAGASAAGADKGKDGGGLWREKERTEALRAQLLELELAEKQGKLVDAEAVRRATMNKARIARDALLSLPMRISAELAAETDPGKVHDRLSVEIRKLCAELSAGELDQTSQ